MINYRIIPLAQASTQAVYPGLMNPKRMKARRTYYTGSPINTGGKDPNISDVFVKLSGLGQLLARSITAFGLVSAGP